MVMLVFNFYELVEWLDEEQEDVEEAEKQEEDIFSEAAENPSLWVDT